MHRKPNILIFILRITLAITICAMQIIGLNLKQHLLLQTRTSEIASITIEVINNEYEQIIPYRESIQFFHKESNNTNKQATLKPFLSQLIIFLQAI